MTERTLLVHIGHPKTGTSYIQSLLASNKCQLQRFGIRFPDTEFTLKMREEDPGRGGNCRAHLLQDGDYHKMVTSGNDTVVLSAERLFYPLSEGDDLLVDYLPFFDRVQLLLFIRDPLDFAASWHNQRSKRGDFNGSLDEFVVANDYFTSHLDRVEKIISLCTQAGYDLCIKNYSKISTSLDEIIADVLHISLGALKRPALKKVNRGLTRGELYFQQRLNYHLESCRDSDPRGSKVGSQDLSYKIVSNALSTALPELQSEYGSLSMTVYDEFCRRNNLCITRINPLLPESERYDTLNTNDGRSCKSIASADVLTFSKDQVDALAQSIAKALRICQF